MTSYKTNFFGETYKVSADWDNAASPVYFEIDGDPVDMGGQQVADCQHSPRRAMYKLIERNVELNFDDSADDLRAAINDAVVAAA